MAAGDGLLVRVKPRGNRLGMAQARGVSNAAIRFGNGVLGITNRANLQIRGATEAGLPGLLAELDALELLDASAAAEAARNVVASPLAGTGFPAALDILPTVRALEDSLVRDAGGGLPAKFGWTIDDGGPLDLSAAGGDVRFTAVSRPAPGFLIHLDGGVVPGFCAADGLVAAARALAAAFLAGNAARGVRPHRMRDLVALCGEASLFVAAGLPLAQAEAPARPALSPIGVLRADGAVVGVAPAFGRLEAGSLLRLADAAAAAGGTALHLGPWRGVLLPGLREPGDVVAAAARAGFVTDPADPRLAVAACAGAPACHRAAAPVQAHAARLAPLLAGKGTGTRLHLSGCGKGCAHPGPAPLTMVATPDGYDAVRNGKAGDPPARSGMSLEAAAAMVAAGAEPCMEGA